MALLIYGLDRQIGNAQAWRDTFAELLPDSEIRIFPRSGTRPNRLPRLYAARFRRDPGAAELEGDVQPLGRGRGLYQPPEAAEVPLGKIEPDGGDPMMTEYTVMHVLRFHREMPLYQQAQANREWLRRPIVRPEAAPHRLSRSRADGEGAGAGAEIARLSGVGLGAFAARGRRNPDLPRAGPVRAVHEPDRHRGLPAAADARDRRHSVRPHLRDDAEGAMVINIGRGRHVVEADLIAALDSASFPTPHSTRSSPSRCRPITRFGCTRR